jgi:RNA polymerase sigma-70 factor (ECF subfamily)
MATVAPPQRESPSASLVPEDRRLLDGCLRGERGAWEEFHRRFHPLLERAVRFAFLKTLYAVPAPDVENVVQDVYLRLYEKNFARLRTFEGRCPFGAWLRSLAVRHALNYLRDEKRRGRFGGGSLEDLPLGGPPEREPGEAEEARGLRLVVDQLSPLQRTALKMFYYDGLSYRRISALLGIPVATLGSIISRARERLRALLGGRRAEDP